MTLTLDDIPITPVEILKSLADEAPPPPQLSNSQVKKKPPGRSSKQELGSLLVEKYLTHYGVNFIVKAADGKTIYKLGRCLFDPSHTKNEASIIQDVSGKITFQCFHDSCKGRTWADARRQISGEAKLAQFCEGYDPEKAPPPSSPAASSTVNLEQAEFLSVSQKGRVTFNPALFADHLAGQFKPVINEGTDFGGLFYRYHDTGIWKPLPEASIQNKACDILQEHAKSNRLNDSLMLLKHKLFVHPDELAPDPMWLNLKNCMLNVETMECKPHAPEFRSRVQLPVEYDPNATCSLWLDALAGIFADDLTKAKVIQEFIGYCFYPKIIFPCAMFCIGKGGNGKGTIQYIIELILGRENISHVSLQRMEEKFGPIELKDKLLNSCGETSEKRLEVTRFKEICAADEIQAEVKYKQDVKYRPIAKHMISMNSFPGIKDQTHAFFRRIIVLEFNQLFEDETDDKELKQKLELELNGIFMWALEGLKSVLEKKAISQPDSVLNAKNRMRQWVNPIVLFVDEICMLGEKCKVFPADLFRRYMQWCESGNVAHPVGKQKFYEQIMTNFAVRRGREHLATKEHFEGIMIRPDEQLSFNEREE